MSNWKLHRKATLSLNLSVPHWFLKFCWNGSGFVYPSLPVTSNLSKVLPGLCSFPPIRWINGPQTPTLSSSSVFFCSCSRSRASNSLTLFWSFSSLRNQDTHPPLTGRNFWLLVSHDFNRPTGGQRDECQWRSSSHVLNGKNGRHQTGQAVNIYFAFFPIFLGRYPYDLVECCFFWRLYTTRGFRQSLRDAYAGWVLLRRLPSRLLHSMKKYEKAFALALAPFFGTHYFCGCCSFPVRSWRSRSRRREKWKKWDCVCQSSGKAPNRRVKHGKTCSRKAVSWCFMVIFCLREAFAEPSRGFAEKPLYYLQKRRIAFTLPKVMMKIWHWPLKNFWIEYELPVWVALHV